MYLITNVKKWSLRHKVISKSIVFHVARVEGVCGHFCCASVAWDYSSPLRHESRSHVRGMNSCSWSEILRFVVIVFSMKSEKILWENRTQYKFHVPKFIFSNCDPPYIESWCVSEDAALALRVSTSRKKMVTSTGYFTKNWHFIWINIYAK